MSPNGYYVPYEKTLLQSISHDGGGHVNEQTNEANDDGNLYFQILCSYFVECLRMRDTYRDGL